MKWERVLNSFIFCPNNIALQNNDLTNFKVSSNIFEFYNSPSFTLDDITNIDFNISHSILSSSITNKLINIDNLQLNGYIHNLKITISIRIEYKTDSGIKLFTFSSSIGDFIISSSKLATIKLYPLIICLWRNNSNIYNATLTYNLYEIV